MVFLARNVRAGDRAAATGRPTDAEHEYREALAGLAKIRKEAPRSVAYASEEAAVATKLADLVCKLDRFDEAEADYLRAISLAQRLTADFPDELVARRAQAATAHLGYAKLLKATGRSADAVAVLDAAHKFGRRIPMSPMLWQA